MSHYDSLISLKNTIKRIRYFTRLSLLPSFPLIDFLYENVITSLQYSLISEDIFFEDKMLWLGIIYARSRREMEVASHKREKREFYRGRDWNALDEELREATCNMEDVPLGPKYRLKQVLLCILSQLNHEIDNHACDGDNNNNNNKKKRIRMDDDESTLGEYVRTFLEDKRYLFLFDDVWDTYFLMFSLQYLPDYKNGSRVILTTRVSTDFIRNQVIMRFLDKEESWDLLRKKVFGTDSCPYELKKLGKKIAEKCEGLPLAILSVGNHLADAEKTVEYWASVADKGIASIIAADDEVFKVLHPSYQYLPLRFKPLFLYLGVFPQCSEIFSSEMTRLLTAEGVLEDDTLHYLIRIKGDNLVIAKQDRVMRPKSCSLHIVYWCYCKIQARKENLFQILYTIEDLEGTKSKRRLCLHNNCLFGIKESRDSIASVSNIRSLLCTGPYHKFPVSISLGLKLLRVLDAVAIRFYEFPLEVLKLVLLRYLAFTFDGNLPPSISQLISLEFLIVRRHTRIIDPKRPSYLPSKIWSMKELKHLQVVGSDLPEPPHRDAQLPNLLKLLDVTPRSCTKNVLEKIPNLSKLGVQIVLPFDATEPPSSLDYLRELDQLESLKCEVVNPRPSSSISANAYPTSIFPEDLRKLSLSGFGYSWDHMSNIARLTMLERLKLRHCAFRGSSWEVKDDEFHRLELLILEDIDLRYWSCSYGELNFGKLRHLIIEHCYNLERITMECINLLAIEIVDCKQSVVDWAERCLDDSWCSPDCVKIDTLLKVVSSWKDGKDLN